MDRYNYSNDNYIQPKTARRALLLEGTQAARVLRRWLKEDINGPKVDKVLVFNRPWVPRSGGQEAMAKGVRTILRDLQPLLTRAGIEVEHMTPPELTAEERREKFSEAFEPEPPEPAESESVDLEPEPVQDTA